MRMLDCLIHNFPGWDLDPWYWDLCCSLIKDHFPLQILYYFNIWDIIDVISWLYEKNLKICIPQIFGLNELLDTILLMQWSWDLMPWSMIDPIMDKSCFSFNNNSNFSRSFIDSFWLTTLESKFKSIQKSQIGKLHDEIRSEFLFLVSFPPKMMVFFHSKSAPPPCIFKTRSLSFLHVFPWIQPVVPQRCASWEISSQCIGVSMALVSMDVNPSERQRSMARCSGWKHENFLVFHGVDRN